MFRASAAPPSSSAPEDPAFTRASHIHSESPTKISHNLLQASQSLLGVIQPSCGCEKEFWEGPWPRHTLPRSLQRSLSQSGPDTPRWWKQAGAPRARPAFSTGGSGLSSDHVQGCLFCIIGKGRLVMGSEYTL